MANRELRAFLVILAVRYKSLKVLLALILSMPNLAAANNTCVKVTISEFSPHFNRSVDEVQYYVESSWSVMTIEVGYRDFFQRLSGKTGLQFTARQKASLIFAAPHPHNNLQSSFSALR